MLNFVDKAFNQMSLAIEPGIVIPLCQSALVRWDNCFCTRPNDLIDKVLSGVTTVSDQPLKVKACNQIVRFRDVVTLTGSQEKAQRIA